MILYFSIQTWHEEGHSFPLSTSDISDTCIRFWIRKALSYQMNRKPLYNFWAFIMFLEKLKVLHQNMLHSARRNLTKGP